MQITGTDAILTMMSKWRMLSACYGTKIYETLSGDVISIRCRAEYAIVTNLSITSGFHLVYTDIIDKRNYVCQ